VADAALDIVLAAAVLGTALAAVLAPRARPAVLLFVAFGLLAALCWARLGALDVALAEAAIGAGVTGALLLDALARRPSLGRDRPAPRAALVAAPLAAGAFAVVAAIAVLDLPAEQPGLAALVAGAVPQTGAEHPVTAVLLDLRAIDTWLEVAVVLAAAVGAAALAGELPGRDERRPPAGPLLGGFVRLVAPLLVLVGGYLLWRGTSGPGGAFQGGAMLAAAAVLAVVAGLADPMRPGEGLVRWLLAAGAVGFGAVAVVTLAAGRAMLDVPADVAGPVVIVVETGVTLAVAATLAALFVTAGARGHRP
jgi:multisubunit Na+/H+ antiporter MnhB subunit